MKFRSFTDREIYGLLLVPLGLGVQYFAFWSDQRQKWLIFEGTRDYVHHVVFGIERDPDDEEKLQIARQRLFR